MDENQQLRLFYSARDFQLALSAWTFFMEVELEGQYSPVELRRFRCYQDSAVMAYGRPFVGTGGLPPLTLEGIGVTPTAEQLELHERLTVYRDKIVAYSDPDHMRILVTSIAVGDDGAGPYIHQTQWDEGLDLLDYRREMELWLHTLIAGIAKIAFHIVQDAGPNFYFQKDHLTAKREDDD